MWKLLKFITIAGCFLWFFWVVSFLTGACTQGGVKSPTGLDIEKEPGTQAGATTTIVPPDTPTLPVSPPPTYPKPTGGVEVDGDEAKGHINTRGGEVFPGYLAVYLRPGTQHRYSMDTKNVKEYGTTRFATELPPCGCEDILVQIDLNAHEEPPEIYRFPDKMPGMPIANMQHTIRACKECTTCELTVAICEAMGPGWYFDADACECKWEGDSCENYDIRMDATKTTVTDTEVTYHFDVLVDGNLVAEFNQTYARGDVTRTETECYVAVPTDGLECEVCVEVEIEKKPPPCVTLESDCFSQQGQFRCEDLGLVTLFKDETGGEPQCTTAAMNAVAAIVKGGTWYHVIPNVTQGDQLCTCFSPTFGPRTVKGWSHVEYCGCPEPE